MTGRVVFLGLLLICVAADAEKTTGLMRKPSCPDTKIGACTMNYVPLCGSDGNTYGNECTLCVERQNSKKDIWIVKDGSC